jgi:hypothetical protein
MNGCKENSILTDAQFGFIPEYGTQDAIFALYSVITKTLRKGKRLYCCFVDYVKAFDSVSHYILWQKLLKCGISGNLLILINSMYSKLKTCVKLKGEFSEFFSCNVGSMQWESLSPFLYSIYVNEIEMELIKQGIEPYDVKMLNLYLFMYADDTVLSSESITELQKMINTVNKCLKQHGLYINLLKTKIVVFRNRGVLKENDSRFKILYFLKHHSKYSGTKNLFSMIT